MKVLQSIVATIKALVKSPVATVKKLWAEEPVLVGSLVPLLTTAGVLTAAQGSAVTSAVSGVVSLVAVIAAAVKVRSKVSPVKLVSALGSAVGSSATQMEAVLDPTRPPS